MALEDVSLEIKRGSCTAIIGYNGSGKTTLVQHFNGLLRPTSGSIVVDGVEVGVPKTDLRAVRRKVGMLFQFPEAQLFERTVYADVAFGPKRLRLGKREIRTRVHAALEIVGLPAREYAARSPFDLSGGQRRRVALAGVLAMSPSILVLDEPTVGLDAEGREELYRYLRRIQNTGVTIVLVSHDMVEVAEMANQIFVLYHGKITMQGTPREVFANSEQLRAWHLAPPPLAELQTRLRQRGLELSEAAFTLDELVALLLKSRNGVRHA
jgi:energy-coupling factor transport system ATP-binding protein